MNLKPAVLKNLVFDWALCFRLYRFQNLVGLKLPIKHALSFIIIEILPYLKDVSKSSISKLLSHVNELPFVCQVHLFEYLMNISQQI